MKKLLPLLLLFISCSKEHSTINQLAKEDSVSMIPVMNEMIASIPAPNGNFCGAGAYSNIIYNPYTHMNFIIRYGFNGANLTYGNLDSWGSGNSFWVNNTVSWASDYLGAAISGWVMTNTAIPHAPLEYNFSYYITPQTCMIHWNWQPQ